MTNLKKIILTSFITAGSFGSYGQDVNLDNRLNKLNYKAFKFPEEVYSENLCINLNDKIYHVTKKNEEQGMKDLIKMRNEDYEEAWFYFPEKQIWYEVGMDSDSNSVEPFLPLIRKILEENKNEKKLTFYHNHHGEGFDRPSIYDLTILARFSRIFPEREISGKIITKDDITEYSLDYKRKEEILNKIDFQGYLWAPEKHNELFEYFDIKCTPF